MFKRIFVFALSMLFVGHVFAQTVDEMIDEAKQLEKQMKEVEALDKYKEVLKIKPDQLSALTAASELCSREGNRQKSKEDKSRYFNDAKSYAASALAQDANNADANYAMSVAMGRIALISGAKDKVAASKEVQKYAQLALKFNPNYAKAFHVLGKWNYEVANLSAFEKTAAKVLFGGVPEGTLQEAINNYEKCRKLEPSFILNYYDLAKAYKQDEQQEKTIEVLKKAISLRSIYQDDASIKADCKKMLEGLE
jgi:tetratricopeptide (TPR) repeat protein